MPFDRREHVGCQLSWRFAGVGVDDLLEAGFLEWLAHRIFGLGDAVAVKHQELTREYVRPLRGESRSLEHAESDPGRRQPSVAAVVPSDERGVLSGVGGRP